MGDVVTVRTAPRGRPGQASRPAAPLPGRPVLDGKRGRSA
jgi:hypothetical protein